MSHDYGAQRADTYKTFAQIGKNESWPKKAVVVFQFYPEDIEAKWAAVEKALRAKGFRTSHDEHLLDARIGPIDITPDEIWRYERMATEAALPFEFYPEGWELDD